MAYDSLGHLMNEKTGKYDLKLHSKKKDVAGKMAKINLGKKAQRNFAYRIEDHKGNMLKEGGSKKGRASLNPAPSKTGKNEGNKMYESKNEQERM